MNNCTDPNGDWTLVCRIDAGQAEYVHVPLVDQSSNRILDTTPLITHRFPLSLIEEAYRIFEGKLNGVIKWGESDFKSNA